MLAAEPSLLGFVIGKGKGNEKGGLIFIPFYFHSLPFHPPPRPAPAALVSTSSKLGYLSHPLVPWGANPQPIIRSVLSEGEGRSSLPASFIRNASCFLLGALLVVCLIPPLERELIL